MLGVMKPGRGRKGFCESSTFWVLRYSSISASSKMDFASKPARPGRQRQNRSSSSYSIGKWTRQMCSAFLPPTAAFGAKGVVDLGSRNAGFNR
jgi:hypothetical protein